MTRMRKHLEDCRGSPMWLKDLAESHSDNKASKRRAFSELPEESENVEPPAKKQHVHEESAEPPKKNQSTRRDSNLNTFCDTISERENDQLQKELARVIYATGTPLSFTENPLWVGFFAKLRPSFKPPSRDQVSNKYLDSTYEEIVDEVKKKVDTAKFLAIQFDGWSNIRNEGVINVIITTPRPVFYKSIATTVESQTGEYLAQQISKIIEEVGASKILTVCTDSASANRLAWALLKEKYPHIFSYGCVAHILDLLLQDLGKIPAIQRLVTNTRTIVKEIKFSKKLLAKFTEIQRKDPDNVTITLKAPGKTRLGSNIIAMESVQINK